MGGRQRVGLPEGDEGGSWGPTRGLKKAKMRGVAEGFGGKRAAGVERR